MRSLDERMAAATFAVMRKGMKGTVGICAWRIVKSLSISWISQPCYAGAMRDLAVLFLHLLATVARLAGPGGARSMVAESLLVKQQLQILCMANS